MFKCVLSYPKALGGRVKLRVTNNTRNHLPLPVSVLPFARVALLKEHTQYVLNEIAAGAHPRQLINALLQKDPSMRLKEQDLHNLKARLRKEKLNGNQPIPALLLELQERDNYY